MLTLGPTLSFLSAGVRLPFASFQSPKDNWWYILHYPCIPFSISAHSTQLYVAWLVFYTLAIWYWQTHLNEFRLANCIMQFGTEYWLTVWVVYIHLLLLLFLFQIVNEQPERKATFSDHCFALRVDKIEQQENWNKNPSDFRGLQIVEHDYTNRIRPTESMHNRSIYETCIALQRIT